MDALAIPEEKRGPLDSQRGWQKRLSASFAYASLACSLSFWLVAAPYYVQSGFSRKQKVIYHAHIKDTVLYPENVAKCGVLNSVFEKSNLPSASGPFRAVGYGHGAATWKAIIQVYMDVDYDGILSFENEDPILTGEVGVAYVLKNVPDEILGS